MLLNALYTYPNISRLHMAIVFQARAVHQNQTSNLERKTDNMFEFILSENGSYIAITKMLLWKICPAFPSSNLSLA